MEKVRVIDIPIIDPGAFLNEKFTEVEIGRLSSPPTKEFVKGLPKLQGKTGLALKGNTWYIIKTDKEEFSESTVPPGSVLLLHSNIASEGEEATISSIPSINDFLYSPKTEYNLISSQKGLTQYWPATEEESKVLHAQLLGFEKRLKEKTLEEYLQFLKTVGARFEVHEWDKMDDEKFNQLMKIVHTK